MSFARLAATLMAVLVLFAVPQLPLLAHDGDSHVDKALYTDSKACGAQCSDAKTACDACAPKKAAACGSCDTQKAAACANCASGKACDDCASKKAAGCGDSCDKPKAGCAKKCDRAKSDCGKKCDKSSAACNNHGCDHGHVCVACNSLANTHGAHASRSSNVGHHAGDCCEKPGCGNKGDHQDHGMCCDGHDHHSAKDDCHGHHDCGWFGGHHHCRYGHLTVSEQTRN